jgi:hypothetical protein
LKEAAAGDAMTFNEQLQLEDTHKEVDVKFKKNQEDLVPDKGKELIIELYCN